MIDKSLWSAEEIQIFELYSYRCIRCQKSADILHEIIPKSKRPKTWNTPENRVPLCANCHELAHKRSTKNSRALLEYWQKFRLGLNR